MNKRWILSTFPRNADNQLYPVAAAYGGKWRCPLYPSTDEGMALVEIFSAPLQLQAAAQDPRLVICPRVLDPSPLPQAVIDTYADRGAVPGMNMSALLAMLSEIEPIFEQDF